MKKLISNYTFNPASKTISFDDFVSIDLEGVLLITNVTDNIIIYNFADPSKGGGINTNTITLLYDTSTMSSSDALQIYYDDGSSPATQLTLEALEDMLSYMKTLVSQTKVLATQTSTNIQRVFVDNGTVQIAGNASTINASIHGETTVRQELTRNAFANGIRANLIF